MMKVCPRCRAINDDDANFCKICGFRFSEEKTKKLTGVDSPTIRVLLPTSDQPAIQKENMIKMQKVREKEKKVIRTVTLSALAIATVILVSLVLNGITIHYIPKGVNPLTPQELDAVFGGSWIAVTNITDTSPPTYVFQHILHTKPENVTSAYFQFFGYKYYDVVYAYLEFQSYDQAESFYLNYTKGSISTQINTYPATFYIGSSVISGITQFGKFVIYIEVYSTNGEPLPYNASQIAQLLEAVEVI